MDFAGYDTAKDMFKAVKEKAHPNWENVFFLDEVQEIKVLGESSKLLATDYDVDLYVTGSNSRMMSSEIADLPDRRYVSFRIYTFFSGISEFKKYTLR